jgi:outer membrane receptor for ferrienterochelin and colicin
MKKEFIYLLFLLFAPTIAYSQLRTISGYVTDSKSGESMINASVFDALSRKGAVTNSYGYYSLTLPASELELEFSYVGYAPELRKFKLSKDTIINVNMKESVELKEITVIGNKRVMSVENSQMSAIEVSTSLIKTVPAIFGETDILKALQLLPGVQGGVEGSAGFYVRGGGPDENLFLLDGVPVYNVNHLGGLFSVFNADAIKNVTLYKGSFPARFGERLSSVVDVRMNDGNNKKLKGNFSIGLISSKLNLEGPLFSEKTTFNISARRTYYDALLQPALWIAAKDQEAEKMVAGYYFYDLNAKISHKFSDTDRLYLSAYMGDDVIYGDIRQNYYSDAYGKGEDRLKLGWNWGNLITALRWNHVINNKLFMNATGTYTRYRFDMSVGTVSNYEQYNPPSKQNEEMTLGYKSGIQDMGLKLDFDYSPHPNHDVKFGLNYTNHTFRPGVEVASMKSQYDSIVQNLDTTIGNSNVLGHETALYLEDNISLGSFLKVNAGLRYSTFIVEGEFYNSLQPRIGLRALITDKLSFKAGYASMSQYIHLLSNSSISLPTDLWVPVTKRVQPMRSHQYSAGFFYNLLDLADVSLEGYYKSMDNLIEYKDGASFLNSGTGWEDKVAIGRGWAYGVEFLLQRNFGKTTGWLGYTWSKSERLFDREGQELNNGLPFPAKYDRRHDVSLVISHKFNKKIDVSGTFVYATGNTGTLALQNYSSTTIPGETYSYYTSLPYISQRNNYRLPDYMRIDLGVNFHKQKKHGVRTWNVSVYNATNQMNPFMVYASYDYNYYNPTTGMYTSSKKLTKLTIFPIIPSVSYTYKF